MAIKELYKVVKDRRNPFKQELVTTSIQHNYQNEFRDLVGLTPLCSQQLEECCTENVVRVTLVSPSFQQSSTGAIEKIMQAKLQLDKFGFTFSETSTTCGIEEKRLSDKLTILINDITTAMKKLNYASYKSKVYKESQDPGTLTHSSAMPGRSSTPSLQTSTSNPDSCEKRKKSLKCYQIHYANCSSHW